MQGRIIKGIAGFYYVHVKDSGIYECKAKGIFRKNKIKPMVGDWVEITVLEEETKTGNVCDILPRKNELIRPEVTNVDQAVIIFATKKPDPHFNLLDRFLVLMEMQGLQLIICFNKCELADEKDKQILLDTYRNTNYRIIFTSVKTGEGLKELRNIFQDKTTALAGPSGVGKSSIINTMQDSICMQTGEISQKIDRGKHTTRHSELIPIDNSTYIMDTPGFSSLFLKDIKEEQLKNYFPEFYEYEEQCRFQGCQHWKEPDCAVKEALEKQEISKSRYDNYVDLYDELKKQRRY